MEKVLFIEQDQIKNDFAELNALKEKINRIYQILLDFGINDPEAVKAPIDAVHIKLKESIKINDSFEVEPSKAVELIGKSQLYRELEGLSKKVVKSSHLDKFRFNKKSFSLKAGIDKEIERNASVILTNEYQINLAKRIENWIDEAEGIAQELNSKIIPMSLVRTLPVLFYKDQKVRIHPRHFIKYTEKS